MSDSLFFHLLDFVAVFFVSTFEFIHHFFATLRKNFFVIDKLVNERQVSLNCGFVFLSLNSKSLFRIFLHLLCLPKREFPLLVLYGETTECGEKDVFFSWKKKSQFFQQESNLRPSGYQSRCSTTELQETRGN